MTRVKKRLSMVAAAVASSVALVAFPAPAAAGPLHDYATSWLSLSSQVLGGGTTRLPANPLAPTVQRTPDVAGGNLAARLPRDGQTGQPLTVLGATGTVCRTFNAYGTRIVVAGPDTSCGFAMKVFATSMTGADPAKNIHYSSPRTMTVTSPATGRQYNMICTEHDGTLFVCADRDGGTAQVWAW
ncbi:hypothetical protein ACFSSC_04215 [Corynebacterium mendelii]|uniref:Secreted protein n=1 Tax=Corynebacterium mendelii TaxID=2765362 RepID=A0A939DY55_9CORY|nr:hypothetical protein [Corynebacterium mendelii]MBN9643390.1 hypothetical protein [Corynebacterium mendelii]